MGAIASGGVRLLNEDPIRAWRIPPAAVEQVVRGEQHELERRELAYRGASPPFALEGRVVILVDDGLATGSTMRAAVICAEAPARTAHCRGAGRRDAGLPRARSGRR